MKLRIKSIISKKILCPSVASAKEGEMYSQESLLPEELKGKKYYEK